MEELWYKDKFLYCEFIVTFACNYDCPYCFWRGRLRPDAYMFRDTGPWFPKGKLLRNAFTRLERTGFLSKADAFRNYTVDQWKELFHELFSGKIAYVSFTGGEPFLRDREINELILTLAQCAEDFRVRFDTNGSLVPRLDQGLRDKISFNVSYHPQRVTFNLFLSQLKELGRFGRITMVNRIVDRGEDMEEALEDARAFAKRGYFMNINPVDFDVRLWTESGKGLLKAVTCPFDYSIKIDKKAHGKECLYPMFGFQLLPNGIAKVAPCLSRIQNIMKKRDLSSMLMKKALCCPSSECVCFHQYSFVKDSKRNHKSFDIMNNYVEENIRFREGVSGMTIQQDTGV